MRIVEISGKKIGEGYPTFIVAEIGCNHENSMERARQMIREAKEAGADAVKFQLFNAKKLVTRNAKKFWDYEQQETPIWVKDNTQYEEYQQINKLTKEDYKELANYAKEVEIIFLATPFDNESADYLEKYMNVPTFKIASCDITNKILLKHIARKNKPIILSTGASTTEEIKEAVKWINEEGNKDVIILHCIVNYPTKNKDLNLRAMISIREIFKDNPVGLSDHSIPLISPSIAVSLGANLIEKHFTFDKTIPGNDHFLSADKKDLKEIIDLIRITEELLGSKDKVPTESERDSVLYARRSLVSLRDIKKGEIIKEDMLIPKRPGTGIPPKDIEKIIGKKVNQDIKEDTVLSFEMIESTKIVAIIQSRMGSTRLPKKAIIDIGGKCLLQHVIERAKKIRLVDEVILATANTPENEVLVNIAKELQIGYFAGSENDVLDRIYCAAKKLGANHVVRICADNPFIDPEQINILIKKHLDSKNDYTENLLPLEKGLPDAVGAEIISINALEKAHSFSYLPKEREHVTLYIRENKNLFKTEHMISEDRELQRPDVKIDVDTQEDLEKIRRLYEELKKIPNFKTKDIIKVYDSVLNKNFNRDG